MGARAWTWLNTGVNFSTLDAGVFDALDGYWTFYPLTPTLIHAAAFRIGGFSLGALRAASLLAGFMLVVLVGLLMREFGGGRKAQVGAALLVAASLPFALSAHLERPNIFVAAPGFAAVTGSIIVSIATLIATIPLKPAGSDLSRVGAAIRENATASLIGHGPPDLLVGDTGTEISVVAAGLKLPKLIRRRSRGCLQASEAGCPHRGR